MIQDEFGDVFTDNWAHGFALGKYQDHPALATTYPDLSDHRAVYQFWRGFETGCADMAEYSQRYELARKLMPDDVYNAIIASVPLII